MENRRKRVVPTWHPAWEGSIKRWTAHQIRLNKWRFDKADEFEDLMQEAFMVFMKVERAYPVLNNASHFFALYKTALHRHFHDKTRKLQKQITTDSLEEVSDLPALYTNTPNLGHLSIILEEMPDELKTVLQALTSGRVRLKLDKPAKKLRQRENHNMRLRRRFSLTSTDPVGDLKTYLLT